MEKNLEITLNLVMMNRFCQSLGPLLSSGSIVFNFDLAYLYVY